LLVELHLLHEVHKLHPFAVLGRGAGRVAQKQQNSAKSKVWKSEKTENKTDDFIHLPPLVEALEG
jgi:hypothetical protein